MITGSMSYNRWVASKNAGSLDLTVRNENVSLSNALMIPGLDTRVVLFDSFNEGTTGWTVDSGTFERIASEGADFSTGYAQLGGNAQATRQFTPISKGKVKIEFWWRDGGTSTAANTNTLFYVLPDNSVLSANSAATLTITRGSGSGANATYYRLTYRDSSGFQNSLLLPRDTWCKIGIILDVDARTYDIVINDVLCHVGVLSANTTYTSIDRIVIASQLSAPNTLLDNVLVEKSWIEPGRMLIDHDYTAGTGEIEEAKPQFDIRNANPQKPITALITHGAFTLGANGAVPDSSKVCFALYRCVKDGVVEIEYKTSPAGDIYMGGVFRFWDFPSATGAGAGVFRIYGGSTNTAVLFLPTAAGVLTAVASTAFTPAADTVYTVRIEMRGRYVICGIKANSMDAGGYTTLLTHAAVDSATGGRGMIAEEYCGPFLDTTLGAADNYVRRFRFSGAIGRLEANRDIAGNAFSSTLGSIKSLVVLSTLAGDQNLFHSRGMQYSHRSRADGDYAGRQRVLFSNQNGFCIEQRTINQTEYQVLSDARPFVTWLRRGPWVADNIRVFDASENFAPDWDFLARYWSFDYRIVTSSGESTSLSNATAHDWRNDTSSEVLPVGHQRVTNFGSGEQVRITQIIRSASTATDAIVGNVTAKFEQTGDPISNAWSPLPSALAVGTDYTAARFFFIERGTSLTLSADVIEGLRDDLASPATFSFTTGSSKTDAAGDYNTDGFNERHGWYEVNAVGGVVDLSLTHGGVDRYFPVFKIWGISSNNSAVSVNGSTITAGTDYVIDDIGDGNALLQILAVWQADTQLVVQ